MGVFRRMLSAPHTSSNSRSREERTRGSSVPAAPGAGSARSGRERTPPVPAGYGPVLRGRNPASRSPQGDLTRPAFVPFGQPSVPLRTPVVSPLPTGAASSSVLPQPPVAVFPNGGNELPQSSAAAFPNVQLSAQVQGLEQMMQQMVLQQQTFMQTMAASVQQQQQSFQQQSQTFMQTMEASMHQQMQLLRQQVASSVPAPPGAPGSPVLESYRISTPSPGRSPPPPPPRDSQDAERDVFAKSDKWLPSLPVIDFTSWKDRISEALGFLTWMEKLTSWVGLGSEVFPNELMHAVRTKDEAVLGQDMLTVEQQKRSIRLLHILRQTFAGHDKSSLILQNYVEGAASYQQSGFVALRLLSKEFCLKSRSECLYFRSQLANQTVKAPTIPEIVRKIESEQHKYSKLLSSLDPDVQSQGLELQEADLVMVLLRSLPEKCRSYCLLHGDSDSF